MSIKIQLQGIDLLQATLSRLGISTSEAASSIVKLKQVMDSGENVTIHNCTHSWKDNTCTKCNAVWVPIKESEQQHTPAGKLAFHIANMFKVTLSEGEHVVKCIKIDTVPHSRWITYRNDYSKITQIRHVSSDKTLYVNYNTLEIIETANIQIGSTVKIKKPPMFVVPIKTNVTTVPTIKQVAKPRKPRMRERPIIKPTYRKIILPDDDE
jgi:hypothetical protein